MMFNAFIFSVYILLWMIGEIGTIGAFIDAAPWPVLLFFVCCWADAVWLCSAWWAREAKFR